MTRPVRPSDIHRLTAGLRALATHLDQPCACGRPGCTTTATHILRATRDATPGPRAATLDQTRTSGHTTPDPPPPDPTAAAHNDLCQLIWDLERGAADLHRLATNWAPTRTTDATTASDDQWCSHHLTTIGVCEPRYRGDLCRWCYDFRALHKDEWPPADLLRHRHEGGRVTATMVSTALTAQRAARKRRRRRR